MLIAEEIWSNIKARNDSQKYFKIDSVEDKLFSPTSKSIGLVVHERFYVLPLKEYQLDFDNLEKLNRLQESFIPKYLNLWEFYYLWQYGFSKKIIQDKSFLVFKISIGYFF